MKFSQTIHLSKMTLINTSLENYHRYVLVNAIATINATIPRAMTNIIAMRMRHPSVIGIKIAKGSKDDEVLASL